MSAAKTVDYPQIGRVEFRKRKGQKSLRISLRPNKIIVSRPWYVSQKQAEHFLFKKQSWIRQNTTQQEEIKDGMHVGKHHRLQIIADNSKNYSRITNGLIKVSGNQDHVRKTIIRALKQQSEGLIAQRLDQLSSQTGLGYKSVSFKSLTGRWGSCDHNCNLLFSCLLVQLPWHLIDYVIIHELCHTKHLNHSTDFWQLVAHHSPNYRQLKSQLRSFKPIIYNTAYGSRE